MQLFNTRKRTSGLALAVALATGSAVVATAVYPAEAHAQRKKKEKKSKAEYSKEFIAAHTPAQEAVNAEAFDLAAARGLISALTAITVSDDEKLVAGQIALNAGIKGNETTLQLQGIEMMLSSSKLAAEDRPRVTFNGYVLSNNSGQYAKARTYLQQAIDLGYSTPTITKDAMQISVAELFWTENMTREGIAYLSGAMDERRAAGLQVDERWYGRAITVAYQNEAFPELWDMLAKRSAEYPTQGNWRDWMNRVRILVDLTDQESLDLLRFGHAAGALVDLQEYLQYVEVVDARRLPLEAKNIIEEGYAKGIVSRDDIFVSDSLAVANSRIAADRADLPSLERDADAADARERTVSAAANAFYSYGEFSKAARFFEKSLNMPGVDTGEALTRLGMSQIGLGDFAAAQETLAKVQGKRAPIAQLWSAYAAEKAGPAQADGPSLGELMGASTQ